ncbi:MAG: phenylalanine--tRNA ligase subunit alpha [Chloroflexota bacterium]|nr:phenylalanine--tRNA ligase subunit alpha [Chloroflexota bacterium]
MLEDLQRIRKEAEEALQEAGDLDELDAWRVTYLGRKGGITSFLRSIGDLPPEQRPTAGRMANEARAALEEAFEARREVLERQALEQEVAQEAIDVRLPGRPQPLGYLHISRQTLREISHIFARMGFDVLRTREVEDDLTNFQLLNFPPDHPARDMQDTFFTTKEDVLLRTHTSPGQIHAMRKYHPHPFRVILPGKCYRYEQVTMRSDLMFYQVEGLVVGRHVTMADLKGVLIEFARAMFGAERRVRFRPSYFPFTEPSAEMDIDCYLCGGEGCPLCKYTGWLEILGSGMVHPNVLRNGGYDPDVFSGFAFGMGPERICMLKHGITDIRYFFSGDVRFLHQFP